MRPLTAADLAAAEAVHPDVILGSAEDQEKLYDDLSRIAPTVMTDGGGGQWKLNLRLVGEGLGRTNDAEQLLTDYDREAAQARRTIAADVPGRPSVAVVQVTDGGLRYAKRDSFAGTILTDAGVRQVGDMAAADAVVLSGAGGADTQVAGAFTRVDDALWWGDGGPLAARAALADLQRALAPR